MCQQKRFGTVEATYWNRQNYVYRIISLIAKKSESDSDVILLTNSKKTLGRICDYRRSFKKLWIKIRKTQLKFSRTME